jgi:nucleoside-diphosphate-sugar epimerase
MRIVVTGADGFIGKNLRLRLAELPIQVHDPAAPVTLVSVDDANDRT